MEKQTVKTEIREWFFLCGILFTSLFLAIILLSVAGRFATNKASSLPPLWDIAHIILPVFHQIDFLFQYGLWISIAVIISIIILKDPSRLPYFLFLMNFWFFIRIFFACITIFGAPEGVNPPPVLTGLESLWEEFLYGLDSKNILFFSGHTGLPYFGAKMFENANITSLNCFGKNLNIPKVLKSWACIMGFTVLLTREHYSVDVAVAITMASWIHEKGNQLWYKLFNQFDETIDKFKGISKN